MKQLHTCNVITQEEQYTMYQFELELVCRQYTILLLFSKCLSAVATRVRLNIRMPPY